MGKKENNTMDAYLAPIPEEAKLHHEKMKFWSDIIAAAFRCFLLFVGALYLLALFLIQFQAEERSWTETIFMWVLVPSALSLLFLFYVVYYRTLFTVMAYTLETEGNKELGVFVMFWLTWAGIIIAYGVLSGKFLEVSSRISSAFINQTIGKIFELLP